jgi:hypothetical protein
VNLTYGEYFRRLSKLFEPILIPKITSYFWLLNITNSTITQNFNLGNYTFEYFWLLNITNSTNSNNAYHIIFLLLNITSSESSAQLHQSWHQHVCASTRALRAPLVTGMSPKPDT